MALEMWGKAGGLYAGGSLTIKDSVVREGRQAQASCNFVPFVVSCQNLGRKT